MSTKFSKQERKVSQLFTYGGYIMYALYAEVVSRSYLERKINNDYNESDAIDQLYRLSESTDDEDPEGALDIDNTLYEVCNVILRDVFTLFASRNDDQAFRRLAQVDSLCKEFGSEKATKLIAFHVYRLKALGYAWSDSHLKAIKSSNKAIANCPIINGGRAKGLVDILILISDSYSALNKFEEGVHSAKLGVDIAHDLFEKSVDETFINGTEDDSNSVVGGVRTFLGPLLNSTLLLIFAYYNLATQLRHGDEVEASIIWYEKAIQRAESNGVDEDIISVLFAGLADAEKHLSSLDYESARKIQARDTVVGDRISNGIEEFDAQNNQNNTGQNSQKSSHSSRKVYKSGHTPSGNHQSESQRPPSESETSMTSSDRNDPANHNDGQAGGKGGDVHDIYDDPNHHEEEQSQDYQYRVENMTNNSTIPTQTQNSGGGTTSSHGGGGKGWKNKRHDPNSTNDDISHITGDDENVTPHYYFPTQKQRPKSALSKLGRDRDAISVTSLASSPQKVRQKRHSFGGELPHSAPATPTKGGGSSLGSVTSSIASRKYHQPLRQEQLYDNSEVNRMVVERSMEWNGHADSTDAPIPTIDMLLAADVKDPMLKSIQETLSKQFNDLILFREKVLQLKKNVTEQEKAIEVRTRKLAKDESKAERKKTLSTAVEMAFERRCAHDDRIAQRLKAADDIKFVERGSEHFFEGMVVDIKRSSKANSERDRCVIVRARINGSFDAEIIENGELLINIHPNLIRIPSLPGVDDKRIVAHEYRVGEKVSCRAGKYGRWFTGFVEKVLPAGHYRIEYADGSVEENVSHKRMRPVKSSNDKDPHAGFDIALVEHEYYVGQEVLMRFPYGCRWRLCTVTKVRCDGEAYDVLLNGRQEPEKGISRSCLRHQGSLLYGYGEDYCPSQKALIRCASAMPDVTETRTSRNQYEDEHRVVVDSRGEYSLKAPSPKYTNNPQFHSTGKKNIRQLEDSGVIAVSRSDRNVELKHITAPTTAPMTPLSPTKQEKGMAATPSSTVRVVSNPASNGVVISTLRDRFVQEMHRNVSLLNTSATERKFARIIRQERRRMDSIVAIQAAVRGFLTRTRIKHLSSYSNTNKELQINEGDLSKTQIDLMDRYMQALSVAIFKNDSSTDMQSPDQPLTSNSMAAMKRVSGLISTHLPDAVDMQEEIVEMVDVDSDPIEKLKKEMIDIHNKQLKQQQDEMKELFAREMKGLGSQIIQQLHHEDNSQEHQVSQGNAIHDTSTSGNGVSAFDRDDEQIFGLDNSVIQDIDWMKDMYLSIWGGSSIDPVEVVAIIARSKTHFTILEASLPHQLCNVVHMAEGGNEYVQFHHVFFAKLPENKENYAMKVRLENATGKSCRLKCPGDKIADLCDNKRSVKITLDSKNQFEISASSLHLDAVARSLECLWDAHVAWSAQRLLLRIALHRIIQGISALFVHVDDGVNTPCCNEAHESANEDNDGKENENSDEVCVHENSPVCLNSHARWLSQRYLLFQELSNTIKTGQQYFQDYQACIQQFQEELTSAIKDWRFFQHSHQSQSPASDVSDRLCNLAESIFLPYDIFFQPDTPFVNFDGSFDNNTINEHLHKIYDQNTVKPILKDIYLSFIAQFSVEAIFEQFFLGPLMTLGHQKLVKGYAYAEAYDWENLCAHTRTWSHLIQGYKGDIKSNQFELIHEKLIEILIKADEALQAPVVDPPLENNGLEVISAIEELTTSALVNPV